MKTTSVAYFVKKLIQLQKQNATIWYSGPKKTTATNLAGQLGEVNPNHVLDKEELFNTLLSDKGKAKYAKMQTSQVGKDGSVPPESEYLHDSRNNGMYTIPEFTAEDLNPNAQLPDFMFIDEVTHFTSGEQQLLQKIFELGNKNTVIFALGDRYQNGVTDLDGHNILSTSAWIFETPYLNMSVRANNTTKLDNQTIITSLLKKVATERAKADELNVNWDPTDSIRQAREELPLKYYEKDGVLHGEKVVSQDNFNLNYNNILLKLVSSLKPGEKIGVISNNISSNGIISKIKDFKAAHPEYTDIFVNVDPKNVQGAEYAYTIIDYNWNPMNSSTTDTQFYNELKTIYTLTTRSQKGSIILDNGNFMFKNNQSTPISKEVELSNENMSSYRDFLVSVIPTTEESINSEKIVEISTTTIEETEVFNLDEVNKVVSKLTPKEYTEEEIEKFKTNNSTVITNFNTKGNPDEDLGALEKSGGAFTNILIQFRGLVTHSPNFIKSLNNNTLEMNDLSRRLSQLLGVAPKDLIKVLETGQMRIKVKTAEAGDVFTVGNRSVLEGDRIAKLIYLLDINGKTVDITLGYLDKNEHNSIVNEELKGDGTTYLDINNSNILTRKFEIVLKKTIQGADYDEDYYNSIENQKANSLARLTSLHPDLVISAPLVAMDTFIRPDNSEWVGAGLQFVLVSSRLDQSPLDLMIRFLNYFLDSSTDISDIGVLPLHSVGMTPQEFFTAWDRLFYGNTKNIAKGKHLYLSSLGMAKRFAALINLLYTYVEQELKMDDKYRVNDSLISTPLLKALVDSLGMPLEEIRNSLRAHYMSTLSTDFETAYNDFGIKWNKFNLADYADDQEKTLLASVIGDSTATAKEVYDKLVALNKTPNGKLEKLTNIIGEFVNGNSGKLPILEGSFSNFLKIAELGKLPPILKSGRIISTIVKGRKDETFRKIIDVLISGSTLFKLGITINPINSVDAVIRENGLFNSALSPSLVYVNALVGSSRIYIDHASISKLQEPEKLNEPKAPELVNSPVVEVIVEEQPQINNLMADLVKKDFIDSLYTISGNNIAIYQKILKDFINSIDLVSLTREQLVDEINVKLDEMQGKPLAQNGELLGIIPRIIFSSSKESSEITIYDEGNKSRLFTNQYKSANILVTNEKGESEPMPNFAKPKNLLENAYYGDLIIVNTDIGYYSIELDLANNSIILNPISKINEDVEKKLEKQKVETNCI